ncbi:hypothetical protein EDB85DRAFT_1887749 [Lactarius pseudohatsudake]|nr:hypothetical protein EDB85DRAFT_1887749 [Lactarius pseudohatsudake]
MALVLRVSNAPPSKQPLLLLPLNHTLKEQRAFMTTIPHPIASAGLARASLTLPRERAPCASNVSPIGSLSLAVNQDVRHVPSLQEHAEVLAATADTAKRQAQGQSSLSESPLASPPSRLICQMAVQPVRPSGGHQPIYCVLTSYYGHQVPSQQPTRPDAQPCIDSSHLAEVNKPPQTSPTLPSLSFLNARNKNPYPFGRVPTPVAAGKGFYGYG